MYQICVHKLKHYINYTFLNSYKYSLKCNYFYLRVKYFNSIHDY